MQSLEKITHANYDLQGVDIDQSFTIDNSNKVSNTSENAASLFERKTVRVPTQCPFEHMFTEYSFTGFQ